MTVGAAWRTKGAPRLPPVRRDPEEATAAPARAVRMTRSPDPTTLKNLRERCHNAAVGLARPELGVDVSTCVAAGRFEGGKGVKYQSLAGVVLTLVLACCPVHAADIKPGVLYDLGGKFDKSFNEGVWNGARKFTADTGIEFRDFEVQTDSQRIQALRTFARQGFDPVLAVGFQYAPAMEEVAAEFPETRFAIIDAVVDQPNVQSIVFREHEGAFVVGILAAMASQTGKVGFVGGMDVPLIRRFACGYVLGAQHASPDVQVFQNMTGTTAAAWNDPVKGAELARSQFDRGADVVFHAAGTTGLGVLQAAADAGRLGIGVDSNQNHLHPGHVLTSMLKRVDVAAYEVFDAARQGAWRAGTRELGLNEGGIGWALDEFNRGLVSPAMQAAADRAVAAIKSGEIWVHDYVAERNCPAP